MPRYLIDVNLPRYFSVWNTEDYLHQASIDIRSSDEDIWATAREKGLTIISKDSDFSNRILLSSPPPKVIHVRLGNVSMNMFHRTITACWDEILSLSETHKLVTVFSDRIEAVR